MKTTQELCDEYKRAYDDAAFTGVVDPLPCAVDAITKPLLDEIARLDRRAQIDAAKVIELLDERDEARRQVAETEQRGREAERRDVVAFLDNDAEVVTRDERAHGGYPDHADAHASLDKAARDIEAGRHVGAPRPAYDPGGPPLWRCSNCGCPEDDHAIGQPRSKCNGCECTEYERCAWASTAEENAAAVAASRGGEEG